MAEDNTDPIDLGTCPVVVSDEETAAQAGQWAQDRAEEILLAQNREKNEEREKYHLPVKGLPFGPFVPIGFLLVGAIYSLVAGEWVWAIGLFLSGLLALALWYAFMQWLLVSLARVQEYMGVDQLTALFAGTRVYCRYHKSGSDSWLTVLRDPESRKFYILNITFQSYVLVERNSTVPAVAQ